MVDQYARKLRRLLAIPFRGTIARSHRDLVALVVAVFFSWKKVDANSNVMRAKSTHTASRNVADVVLFNTGSRAVEVRRFRCCSRAR